MEHSRAPAPQSCHRNVITAPAALPARPGPSQEKGKSGRAAGISQAPGRQQSPWAERNAVPRLGTVPGGCPNTSNLLKCTSNLSRHLQGGFELSQCCFTPRTWPQEICSTETKARGDPCSDPCNALASAFHSFWLLKNNKKS